MSYNSVTPGWHIGKYLVICDRCGFKKTNDQVAKEPFTNLIVCRDTCWEPRHPQEFIRARPDQQAVPFTRPESRDTYVAVTYADTGVSADIPSGTFNTNETL